MYVESISGQMGWRLTAVTLRFMRIIKPLKIPARLGTAAFHLSQLGQANSYGGKALQLHAASLSLLFLVSHRVAEVLSAATDLVIDCDRARKGGSLWMVRLPRSLAVGFSVWSGTIRSILFAEGLRILADGCGGWRDFSRDRWIEGGGRWGVALTRGYLLQDLWTVR